MTTVRAPKRILRRQGMPPEEVRALLAAEDPAIVRRYLELHRERMEEWLADEQRILDSLEGAFMRRGDVADRSWSWARVKPCSWNRWRRAEANAFAWSNIRSSLIRVSPQSGCVPSRAASLIDAPSRRTTGRFSPSG